MGVSGETAELSRRVLEEGEDLAPGTDGSCVLGAELARQLGVRSGDLVRFPSWNDHGPALKVRGVFHSDLSLHTADLVLASEHDARALLTLPEGSVTDLAITLTNPDESAIVAGKVGSMGPGLRVLERRLLERVQTLTYGRRAGLVLGAAIPAWLALLVVAWDRVSGLGGAEKREIAILKASGWSTRDVLLTRLYESTLVGVLSAALGLVAGYAWIFWLGAPGLREVLAGWSVLYPEAPLSPQVDLAQIAAVLAVVVAPFVALSVVPAWRAAIVDPMEAMRS
jgi:ABC-type lipoprotein release transport system permease subunit